MGKKDKDSGDIRRLFNSDELYHIFFENASEAIFFARDFKIIDCNSAVLSLFGFQIKSDLIGSSLFDLSPELQDDRIRSKEKIQELFSSANTEVPLKFTWKHQKYNGIVFESEVSVQSFEHENLNYQQITIRELPQKEDTENELIRTKILLQSIIEIIPQPLFTKDDQYIYTNCNQAFVDYLGKTREEVIGSTVYQISDKEKADIYQKADIELFDSGESQIYESKVQSMETLDRDVIFRKNIIKNQDGTKIGIVGIIDDISEYKKTREELIQTEIKYKKMFENVQDVFYRTDTNGILTEISPSIKRYSKYVHSDIIGQPIENFYTNPSDRDQLIHEIQEKGEALDFEILLKGQDDQEVWSSVNAHFTFDKSGKVNGIEGTIRDLTERKQAEEKLKLSLSLLQATLDSTADGILVVDRLGKINSYNKQFKQIFNLPEEVLESGEDSNAIECVLNQLKDVDLFVSKIHYLYNHPESDSFDTIELKDGRILERFSCPLRLDGAPIGRVWNFRDVTEHKLATEALQAKEAHISTLLQSIPDLIWLKDTNGVYLTCNKMFEQFFGASEADIVGKTDYDFVDKDLADFFRHNDQNAMNSGGPISNEEWITFASDGHKIMLETIKTPMYDAKGKIKGVLGIGRDITYRKQTEELLRQNEAKYRNLIETIPDGVYRSTPEGKFIEVNDAMVRILGYDSKEDLMSIDIKTQLYFDAKERERLSKKMRLNELDIFPLRKKDGSTVYIEDHGWFITDDNGQILFHEGISRDVTQRKNAEVQLHEYSEQLKELVATKDKFFSIIAHDLKSPFNSILGLSEIIKNDARHLDIATIEQYASVINSTSNNTYKLLENLLDWARIQQSQMPFQPVSFILKNLANEVIELSIEKANSKMIAMINYIPDNLIVIADKNMIRTILRNMISNALKFTSTHGKVGIKAFCIENRVVISVKDTGTGIKHEDIEKIFKIGSSFSKRGTENEKGTGLGLLLCKEFVEKHGGHIWVESEEGKGSEFKFSIPTHISFDK